MQQPIDWQVTCRDTTDRLYYLKSTGHMADCSFGFQDDNNTCFVYPAHKFELSLASPVFDTMFNGSLPPKSEPIDVQDVHPDTFGAMLRYIYLDQVDLQSLEDVFDLWYVANKYMLTKLIALCIEFYSKELCVANACRIYEIANFFSEHSLVKRCFEIIYTKTEEVFAAPSINDIELNTLLTIVNQDDLMISSEMDLFMMVAQYAEHNGYTLRTDLPENIMHPSILQKQRQPPLFREVLKKIKYLIVSEKCFEQIVAKSNILTDAESRAILASIGRLPRMKEVKKLMPSGFSIDMNARSYSYRWVEHNVLFDKYSNKYPSAKTPETVTVERDGYRKNSRNSKQPNITQS